LPSLGLLLLILEREPQRFQRAAVRWHARFVLEHNITIREAQLTLAVLKRPC